MPIGRWSLRKAHFRQTVSGKLVHISKCFVYCAPRSKAEGKKAYRNTCPHCHAKIISISMPNGGWVHFEGQKGLTTVRHPCFSRGDRLSKKRDEHTPDLFEQDDERNPR